MAKTVPSAIVLPKLSRIRAGEDVFLSDWEGMAEALHYLYGRTGSHCPGMNFSPSPWATTSTSYVTANSATDPHYDLANWQGLFRFSRLLYGSGAADQAYSCQLDVYAKNLDTRLTMVRLNTEDGHTGSTTTVYTLTTTHSSTDSEWQTDTQEYTKAEASRSGSTANGLAFFLCYLEAKVPSTGTGELWTFSLRETPITAGSALPRGA